MTPQTLHDTVDKVKDEAGFIQDLLIGELEWDIPENTQRVAELGYDWSVADDLGLSPDDRRNLARDDIVQVPLTREGGAWGVFIIRFRSATYLEKGRGLTSPLRKLLRALVRQKPDLPAFRCENILFICADPAFENVTFARFRGKKADDRKDGDKAALPLATFGWRAGDKGAIRTLCEHNLPNLHWAKDWAKAFDIAPVTRAFYQEIFTWFERARARITLPLRDAARVLERDEDDLQAEALIRLVIRMIFIWFMKEKRELVPGALFDREKIEHYLKTPITGDGHSYYNAVLQNLFFATLNCPQDKRTFRPDHDKGDQNRAENGRGVATLYRFKAELSDPDGLVKLLSRVPFLNGGLFTCHDLVKKGGGYRGENYHLDGFSENPANRARVPDDLFFNSDGKSGLIDILKRYHFTIEEHTPLEQEVALDPELLGHVFEHLLAAYNPETRDTARKKTGSYYTPRNIVDYMVGESLYQHLLNEQGWRGNADKETALRTLLDYKRHGNPFDLEDSRQLRDALDRVRIFDPACGSGAFPMGALHRLNHLLVRLNAEDTSYDRKLRIIQNNIYGADIQPIATEITTQRFFISLLIDQEVKPDCANSGIAPLPNLDVKFMTADSLHSLHWKGTMDTVKSPDLFYQAANEQIAAIKEIFSRFLRATTAKEKDDLRRSFETSKKQLVEEFEKCGIPQQDRALFEAWEPFGFSKAAGFFDAQLMFAQADFDIVIGNPPYVRQEAIKDKKDMLRDEFGDFFKGTADLYTYFYRRGVDLLKTGGVLAFITPNKFMTAAYGDKTRQLLSQDAFPRVLIDFNEFPVFEATTYPLIALIEKGKAAGGAVFDSLPEKELAKGDWSDPETVVRDHAFAQPVASLQPDKWVLARPDMLSLLDKLNQTATPLGDYVNDRFYRGIVTGLNAAFVIDADTRQSLLTRDPNSADLIKPWLRGRDVGKWRTKPPADFILLTRHGTDIEKYPAIKAHLEQFREDLEPKNTPGQKKGRASGAYQWHELQHWGAGYHEEFSHTRIIYPDTANEARFSWEEKQIYNNDTSFIIPTDDRFLLAVLNSTVTAFWCWNSLPKIMGGTMRFKKVFMSKLPIPKASDDEKAALADLATQILDLKDALPDADIRTLEQQINEQVYALFRLTAEDIKLIEQERL